MLNELIESNEGNKEKEKEIISECKEVGELKELIPDINSKVLHLKSIYQVIRNDS